MGRLENKMLEKQSIVKIFVIDCRESEKGGWIDRGAGEVQLMLKKKVKMGNVELRDVGVRVSKIMEANQTRDFIVPSREEKLRNNNEDKSVLLDVNLQHARDFTRSQVTIVSWEQTDIHESIALSFLSAWDCRDFWKSVCTLANLQYSEDPLDIKEENIEEINRRISLQSDVLQVYINLLLTNVCQYCLMLLGWHEGLAADLY